MKFSLFDSCFAKIPSGEISLEDLVSQISDDSHRALVDQIRASDPDERSRLKKRLPAITPSGTFSKRSKANLSEHSGAICADLDLSENPSLREHGAAIRARLEEDPSAFLIFESPSGGLKCFFRVEPDAENHAASFAAIAAHLRQSHGLEADESGKDVSRLCFLSHDPSAWHRAPSEAKILEPCEAPGAREASGLTADPGDRPGDIFNLRGDVSELLRRHGWSSHDEKNWTRPGKTAGTSATLLDEKVFYVFTSNAPRLEPGRAYSKFSLFAALEHDGDCAAAARALAAQGFSEPIWDPLQGRKSQIVESAENAPSESLFADIEGALDGSLERILPDLCEISDGRFLLYRGKINEIHGEPAVGKSNVSLTVAAKILMARGRVVLLDPEDTVSTAVSRLLAFGASRDSIREGLRYSNAIEPQNWPEFHKVEADLFIIDGIAEALAAENLNEDVAGDFLHWIHTRIRPFTRGGAAVLLCDHVAKNRESRGAWSRGSSAKIGCYDGAVFEVCEGQNYSPEHEGFVRLKISKDRAGGVGRKGQEVAQIHFAPGVPATFRTAAEISEHAELEARQRVVDAIREILAAEEFATKAKVIKAARMKAEKAARILDDLANENFIEMRAQGAGRATEIKFLI